MASRDDDAFLIPAVRVLLLVVSALGFASILFSLALLTVTSMPLRILIIGVGMVLLATSVFAWRLTAVPVLADAVQLNAFYRRPTTAVSPRCRTVPGDSSGNLCLSPLSYPAWTASPLSMDDWIYCRPPPQLFPIPPPPAYNMLHEREEEISEITVDFPESGIPPPNYSSLGSCGEDDHHHSYSIPSPPPAYRSRMDDYGSPRRLVRVQLNDQHHDRLLSVIDCSKAIPITFHINRSITAF